MSQSCICLDKVVGSSAKRQFTVGVDHTAIALGSGSVNVLATPIAIAWCEAATVAAVAPKICNRCTTVGYKIDFRHLFPTAVGQVVIATALVESISGDRIQFAVELHEADRPVGNGGITRVRVNKSSWPT